MKFGTARSTLSGRISWIFFGTIESSPSLSACVLPVDDDAVPWVGWTLNQVSAHMLTNIMRVDTREKLREFGKMKRTLSGNASSTPLGAAF
jgi:hypothetical protein